MAAASGSTGFSWGMLITKGRLSCATTARWNARYGCAWRENNCFRFYGCSRYEKPFDKWCSYFSSVGGLHNEIVRLMREIVCLQRSVERMLKFVRWLLVVVGVSCSSIVGVVIGIWCILELTGSAMWRMCRSSCYCNWDAAVIGMQHVKGCILF